MNMNKNTNTREENVMNTNTREEECSNSNLPGELCVVIGQKLNTRIEVIQFRSTCSLWRSLVPLPPSSHKICIQHDHLSSLLQTKIYRIQPSSSHSSSRSNKGWLIKVFQDPNSSKFYLLDLFTNQRIRFEKTPEKVLNLTNFRASELYQLYTLCSDYCGFTPCPNVQKVIMFSVEDRCMVFELGIDKKLKVSEIGNKKKTVLEGDGVENKYFDDIILYQGQVYVVDKVGTIFWINALSLKLVQFLPHSDEKTHSWANSKIKKKQLVECDGSLYLVDYQWDYVSTRAFVQVFKLDQEWGKWLNVEDLGDVSFLLGKDSNFALLAQDYYGCEGNCIYFYMEGRHFCFSLDNSMSKPSNSFWPGPTLFKFKFKSAVN